MNKKTHPLIQISFIFLLALLLSRSGFAYLAINETAELIPQNNYQLGLAPQLVLSNGSGANVSVFLDVPVNSSTSGRVTMGGGTTDFWVSTSAKWVPYPDYDKQPAIGLRGALIYGRDAQTDIYGIQIAPILGKMVDTRFGKMTPYVAIPITFLNINKKSTTSAQFDIGTEWSLRRDIQMGAELDVSLSDSITAVSVYFNFPFNADLGFQK